MDRLANWQTGICTGGFFFFAKALQFQYDFAYLSCYRVMCEYTQYSFLHTRGYVNYNFGAGTCYVCLRLTDSEAVLHTTIICQFVSLDSYSIYYKCAVSHY